MVVPGAGDAALTAHRDMLAAVGLAAAAAVALKVPELFGLHMHGPDSNESFYLRNISLFVLPFLATFFAFKRKLQPSRRYWLAAPFIAAALIANLLPFQPSGHTLVLAAIHLPIALWMTIGFAYVGGRWRSHEQRMNFVRFSGEWLIYYALIALGGGILIGFTVLIFNAIGLNAESAVESWIVPCGAAGAFLIGFDLLLVLVLGLLFYAISARDPQVQLGNFDRLRLLLALCALIVDSLALWAMIVRRSSFGFSPNKTAALGLNVLLLVHLAWSAVLYARFLAKRAPFTQLERWQTSYLPVYALWVWVVAALFPVIFNYQ